MSLFSALKRPGAQLKQLGQLKQLEQLGQLKQLNQLEQLEKTIDFTFFKKKNSNATIFFITY